MSAEGLASVGTEIQAIGEANSTTAVFPKFVTMINKGLFLSFYLRARNCWSLFKKKKRTLTHLAAKLHFHFFLLLVLEAYFELSLFTVCVKHLWLQQLQ